MSICGNSDQASECIHDFFVFLWDNRSKLQNISNPKAYLFVSFKRRLIKQLESRAKTDELDLKYEKNYFETSAEDRWISEEVNNESIKKLSKAMKSLSSREREAVHLKYFEKYKNEEIATHFDITNQSVRNLLYRAIQNLKKNV